MSFSISRGRGARVLSSPWFDCLAYPSDTSTDVGEELDRLSGKARTSGLVGLFSSL